jgi:hypothetical protein
MPLILLIASIRPWTLLAPDRLLPLPAPSASCTSCTAMMSGALRL